MITDLDETIKQLLTKKGGINPSDVDIRFETPKREWSATISRPTVNFYLYDVRENHDLRHTEWFEGAPSSVAVRKMSAVRMNLSYLITVWTSNVDDEHRLLWHVLQTLFRYPIIPDDILSGKLADQPYRIETRTAQPDGLFSNPSDFWAALDNEIKPSINFVVTLPLDLDITVTAPFVLGADVRLEQIGNDNEPGVAVSGQIYEKGKPNKPLPGVKILVREARAVTESDKAGHYAFNRLPPGKHTVQVLVKGKGLREATLTVPGENYDIEI